MESDILFLWKGGLDMVDNSFSQVFLQQALAAYYSFYKYVDK